MSNLLKDINHDLGELLQFTLHAYHKAKEGVTYTLRVCSAIIVPPKKDDMNNRPDIENQMYDLDHQWHVIQEPEWTYENCSMVTVVNN